MLNESRFWLAIAALIAGFFVSTADVARAADSAFTTKAPRAILMDAETGAILFQQNADQLAPPASMSKLMTLAVLFRAIKSGRIKTTDEFMMSVNAWRNGGAPSGTSAMMVPVNIKATVNELIQGIAVQSGNDASMCVAEGMAGSEAAFARMMNEEARRIGLTKSTFANSTGLGDPNHMMTARELAMLARYIISEYPEFYPVFAQKEFLYRKHKFINRNPLLFANIGADGLKTGHIAASGYGLVGSAVQGRQAVDRRCEWSGKGRPAQRRSRQTVGLGVQVVRCGACVRRRRDHRHGPRMGRQDLVRAARGKGPRDDHAAEVSRQPEAFG